MFLYIIYLSNIRSDGPVCAYGQVNYIREGPDLISSLKSHLPAAVFLFWLPQGMPPKKRKKLQAAGRSFKFKGERIVYLWLLILTSAYRLSR